MKVDSHSTCVSRVSGLGLHMTSALLANAFRVSFLYTSSKIPSTFFTLLGEGDWILSPIQYLGQRLDVHPIPHKPVPFVGVPGVSGIPEGYYLIGWFPFTDMTHVTNVASQGGIDPSVAMQPWHTPRHAYQMLQCLMVAIRLLTVTELAELLTFDLMWWRVRCQSENRTGGGKTKNK